MYFFKNTAGNWIIGPEPTSLKSKVASELRRDTPTVVTVRTIENRVLLIDRTEVTAIKKNAEGDFYANYAEFVDAVSDFFDNAPASGAKWKTYKALMSQTGDFDNLIARVLNQDEDDYLGDIVWSKESPGAYYGNIAGGFDRDMTFFVYNKLSSDLLGDEWGLKFKLQMTIYPNKSVALLLSNEEGLTDDGFQRNFPIEIKVRQRGTAPVLLSAETNTTGDKVILTFDKNISSYRLNELIDVITCMANSNGYDNMNVFSLFDKNKIVIENDEGLQIYGSDSYEGLNYLGGIIESFDYGLLAPFEDFPITNNVV